MSRTRCEVLVLVGSPHEGGSSTRLAAVLCDALRAQGVEPDCWHLAERPVAACTNCGTCVTSGQCRISDDAWGTLSEHLDAADMLMLVAPVYFAGPSACLKAMLDRCQVYWARKYRLGCEMPAQRPAWLFVVGEGGDPFGSQPLEAICSSALNCASLRIAPRRTQRFIGADPDFSRVPGIVRRALEDACAKED